jgi:hypothetical protein
MAKYVINSLNIFGAYEVSILLSAGYIFAGLGTHIAK